MKLQTFISCVPKRQRHALRTQIALALDVTEIAVRHYANGTRQVPSGRVLPLSKATNYAVRPYDTRPDLYPNPTDGLPPSLVGQSVSTDVDEPGEVLAQLGQPGLNAGSGKAVGQHPVQLIDQPCSNRRIADSNGVQQEQEGNLKRRGGIAQQDGLRRKAGTALGHGKKARNVDAAIVE